MFNAILVKEQDNIEVVPAKAVARILLPGGVKVSWAFDDFDRIGEKSLVAKYGEKDRTFCLCRHVISRRFLIETSRSRPAAQCSERVS